MQTRELHTLEEKKADVQAIQDHKCPECGRELPDDNADYIEQHASVCLPHGLDVQFQGSDHARRHKLLTNLAKQIRGGK